MTKIDEAYSEIGSLIEKAKQIEKSVEAEFKYSPFKYLSGPIETTRYKIRPELIDYYNKKYMLEYTPNYEPTTKFKDLMDEAVGRTGFDSNVIKEWYEKISHDKEKLRELSWKQILKRANSMRGGSYYNRPELAEIVQGNVLILRAHTWSKYSSNSEGYVSYYSKKNYEALQSLIDVVTLKTDPINKSKSTYLTDHLEIQEPEEFYGKHKATHKTVEAYQFYKNDKLKIYFKKPRYAQAVAEQMAQYVEAK